jgi:23S rRNA (cytosine1962-C5)-methyltransferase
VNPALICFEDEHLLVVNKPAGWNTHAPAPFAGEGIYDWLRHREPRWARLAIIHRLDKETSGLLVFGKTPLANRSLTEQFTQRATKKKYLLLTDRRVPEESFTVESNICRVGERYASAPAGSVAGERAVTRFKLLESGGGTSRVLAEPLTGRTHQIRVHSAERGFPILGDVLYGGTPGPRVCLHAEGLALAHPATGAAMSFEGPIDFADDPRLMLRRALIDPAATNAFRLIHGAADREPGWVVDRLGDFLLSQSAGEITAEQREQLRRWIELLGLRGAYHKRLDRQVRRAGADEASPKHVLGAEADEEFSVRENGPTFLLRFGEGYSVGLFLDQRDNRRRFLTNHVAADFPLFPERAAGREVLNVFAYTCGFSVCAAKAGARATSLDLSRKYLDWGRRNFRANAIDDAAHDFIYGDAFDWLRRLAKKGRQFDAVVLDPPTFSQSKEGGVFQAAKDYERLVAAALPVLRAGGVLLASTNAATLAPEDFLGQITNAIGSTGRRIEQQHYVPQPPDFPVTRDEPAYLKTSWFRIR